MGKRHSRRGQFLQRVNASDQLSIQRLLTKSIHLACIDAPSIVPSQESQSGTFRARAR